SSDSMATEFRPSFARVGRNVPKCHCTKDFERKKADPLRSAEARPAHRAPARRSSAVTLPRKSMPPGWPALKEQTGADGAQKPFQTKGCAQPLAGLVQSPWKGS